MVQTCAAFLSRVLENQRHGKRLLEILTIKEPLTYHLQKDSYHYWALTWYSMFYIYNFYFHIGSLHRENYPHVTELGTKSQELLY